MRLTRRNQLWALVLLSGLTAVAQYAIQGVLASAHDPTTFDDWFWIAEYVMWGIRALLEAWIVVYLFMTKAETKLQQGILIACEVVVLGLIALTVGPAFRTLGYMPTENYVSAVQESLGEPFFTLWSFGIGAYTAIMMASAGIAYRMQPYDVDATEDSEALEHMQGQLAFLQDDLALAQQERTTHERRIEDWQNHIARLQEDVKTSDLALAETQQALAAEQEAVASLRQTMHEAITGMQWLNAQKPTTIARIVALACDNGNRPAPSDLGSLLNVNASTITRAYASKDKLLKELQEETG